MRFIPTLTSSLRKLCAFFERPWGLNLTLATLFVGTMVAAFWEVLPGSVLFLAPDAPLEPLTFREACAQLASPAPALLNLFRLIPFPWGYECSFWFDMMLLGATAFLLLRSYRLPWGSAWVGAFAAAFTGYFATLFCAGHRGIVDAIAVTAFAFWLLQRAVQSQQWRWFVALGLVLPLGLAAQADIWFIFVLGLAAYALVQIALQCRATETRSVLRRLAPRFALALLLFGLTGIPALRHTFGAAQATRSAQLQQATAAHTSRTAERHAQWRFTTDWSLPPEDCIDFLWPNAKGCTSYAFDPSPYRGRMGSATQVLRQHSIHIGALTLLLALLAVAWRNPDLRHTHRSFWASLAVISLLLAFGRYTPFYQWVWHLPFIDQIRAPVKWLHLTGFAVALLAGMGSATLLKRSHPATAVLLCTWLAITSVCVIRPFVFPIRLPDEARFAQLPPHARVFATANFHAFLRAHGYVPTDNPYRAHAALMLRPAGHGFELKLILPEVRR